MLETKPIPVVISVFSLQWYGKPAQRTAPRSGLRRTGFGAGPEKAERSGKAPRSGPRRAGLRAGPDKCPFSVTGLDFDLADNTGKSLAPSYWAGVSPLN